MLTPDQHGARTAFERLGFRVEAALHDWVQDRRGRLRDIHVVTYELDGFTDQPRSSGCSLTGSDVSTGFRQCFTL
jgi:hypothetical protein